MAGIVALLNQYLVSNKVQSQPGLGNINPTLYRLANIPGVFHDVAVGDNKRSVRREVRPAATAARMATAQRQATIRPPVGAPRMPPTWFINGPTRRRAYVPVVVSFDQNPVFQTGSSWPFTITLTEEAGIGTTLTAFSINGTNYNIASTFGATSLAPGGSVSSRNFSLTGLSVPANVVFAFAGMDATARPVSSSCRCPLQGPRCS